jgi:hypothetical protein
VDAGHDLPQGAWVMIVAAIAAHTAEAELQR